MHIQTGDSPYIHTPSVNAWSKYISMKIHHCLWSALAFDLWKPWQTIRSWRLWHEMAKSSTDKEQGVLGWWHEWGIPGFHGLFYLHASLTRKKHKNYNQTTPFFQCSTSSDLTNQSHRTKKAVLEKWGIHTLQNTTQTSVINCLKDINK